MMTSTGLRLGDRYTLRERLAVGGMGEVWTASDEKLNRPVAVKVLRMDLAPEQSFQARFRAEARTAAGLSHGGIAAVFDYGEAAGSAYLVMELVPGEPLSAMISREGALGTDTTLQVVAQAARALHAAHRHGVVHRDIKPANLMVTPELRVKVTDFGIARPRDHEPLTATGQVMGTAHYLAPELARGEVASPLSDVYALGVVMYECLAGWRPFEGDNQVAVATAHLQDEPPPLPATIPAAVRRIVVQAMAKDKTHRPQGAHELARLLEDLRLRGLAGDYDSNAQVTGTRPASPPDPWPLDAATPPRGGYRDDRSDPATPRPDGRPGELPVGPSHAPSRSQRHPAHPPAHPATRTPHQPAHAPSRRHSHPPTLQVPVATARRRGPRRFLGGRLSVPMLALLVLVAIVLVGALLHGLGLGPGGESDAGSGGRALPGHAPDTGVAHGGTGMEGSGLRVATGPVEGSAGEGWLV